MRLNYRIIAVLSMIFLLVIGVIIISGVTSKAPISAEYMQMQLGIG